MPTETIAESAVAMAKRQADAAPPVTRPPLTKRRLVLTQDMKVQAPPPTLFYRAIGNDEETPPLFLNGKLVTAQDCATPEAHHTLFLSVPTLGVGAGYELRTSTIPGAGRGLFARRDYSAHEIVTVYEGAVFRNSLVEHDLIPAAWQTYAIELSDHYIIIGNHPSITLGAPGYGAGAMLNDARDPARNNCRFFVIHTLHNAFIEFRTQTIGLTQEHLFIPQESFIAIVTTRAVQAGEEFFVRYSNDDSYWINPEGDASMDAQKILDMKPRFVCWTREKSEANWDRRHSARDSPTKDEDWAHVDMPLPPLAAVRLAMRADGGSQFAWRWCCWLKHRIGATAEADVDWRAVHVAANLVKAGRSLADAHALLDRI